MASTENNNALHEFYRQELDRRDAVLEEFLNRFCHLCGNDIFFCSSNSDFAVVDVRSST
jgi:hypothetical protein